MPANHASKAGLATNKAQKDENRLGEAELSSRYRFKRFYFFFSITNDVYDESRLLEFGIRTTFTSHNA